MAGTQTHQIRAFAPIDTRHISQNAIHLLSQAMGQAALRDLCKICRCGLGLSLGLRVSLSAAEEVVDGESLLGHADEAQDDVLAALAHVALLGDAQRLLEVDDAP